MIRHTRFFGLAAAVSALLALGCGGVSSRDGSRETSSMGEDAGAMTVVYGGAAGTVLLDGGAGGSFSSNPDGGNADANSEYVEVDDTTTTRLTNLSDANVDANASCQIHATGTSGCGVVNLRLSACSTASGAGACLDTASSEPHYTAATGKRWTMLTLTGSSAQLKSDQADSIVDLDLTLSLSDGSTSRELAVHARVCARIVATLVPCR